MTFRGSRGGGESAGGRTRCSGFVDDHRKGEVVRGDLKCAKAASTSL